MFGRLTVYLLLLKCSMAFPMRFLFDPPKSLLRVQRFRSMAFLIALNDFLEICSNVDRRNDSALKCPSVGPDSKIIF